MSLSTFKPPIPTTGSEERNDAIWARVFGDDEPWLDVEVDRQGESDDQNAACDFSTFLDEVYGLAGNGEEDRAIDVIFEHVNGLLIEGRFDVCDRILAEVDIARIPPVLMISFLTITAAAKPQLHNRDSFFRNVAGVIARERGERAAERLLNGLE